MTTNEILTLIGILFVAIVVSLMNTCMVVPYSKSNSYHAYEGATDMASSTPQPKSTGSTSPTTTSNTNDNDFNSDSMGGTVKPTSSATTLSGVSVSSADAQTISSFCDDNTLSSAMTGVCTNIKNALNPTTGSSSSKSGNTNTPKESFSGMDTIKASNVNNDVVLDTFSLDKGSLSCAASPYSNSQGYICMTPVQQQQLSTRGGNKTNIGDVYGSS